MLNTIKSMILEKESLMEAADLLLEETQLHHIPNSMILGEEGDDVEPDFGDDSSASTSDDMSEGEESSEDDEPEEKDDNQNDLTLNDDDDDSEIMDQNISDELQDQDVDDGNDQRFPGDDDLPEPVGKQTGEPINPDNDLLSTEIDLTTNTMKDTLPVPPGNASDAVGGDMMDQRVDSGYGDDDSDEDDNCPPGGCVELNDDQKQNPMLSKLADMINHSNGDSIRVDQLKSLFGDMEGNDLLSEAITLGDPPEDNNDTKDNNDDDKTPAEGDDKKEEDEGDTPPDDNIVTAAVKDKVAESDDDLDTGNGATDGNDSVKNALLKKLSNLSKNIEDAKKQIIDSL